MRNKTETPKKVWTFAPGIIATVGYTERNEPFLACYVDGNLEDAIQTVVEHKDGRREIRVTSFAWKTVSSAARRVIRDRKEVSA